MAEIYLVTRTDSVGYDEYDSFVIRAESPEAALAMAAKEATTARGHTDFTVATTTIEVIAADGEPKIILGSFNAG